MNRRTVAAAITIAALTAPIKATVLAPTANAVPTEDSPQWSCVDDGNHICGPGNVEGKPAACYDDGGVLFAAWPCKPWAPSDGYRHGDGTITSP